MSRRISGLVCAFMLLGIADAYSQSLHYLVRKMDNLITSKWEKNSQGESCLNYYNSDFSDYIRFCEGDVKVIRPGKNTIYTRKGSELESAYKYGKSYHLYRGRFPKKDFDPFFVYAFPVKSGKKVMWKIDRREPKRTLCFRAEYRDTVYASRSGRVCMTEFTKDCVLLYHDDSSFAGYLNMDETFVTPGMFVRTGQPIGLAGHTDISMTVFFLDPNMFEGNTFIVHPYTHIMPVFRTDEGDVKLEERKIYRALTDTDLITAEMGKAEKKRYLKNLKK